MLHRHWLDSRGDKEAVRPREATDYGTCGGHRSTPTSPVKSQTRATTNGMWTQRCRLHYRLKHIQNGRLSVHITFGETEDVRLPSRHSWAEQALHLIQQST